MNNKVSSIGGIAHYVLYKSTYLAYLLTL